MEEDCLYNILQPLHVKYISYMLLVNKQIHRCVINITNNKQFWIDKLGGGLISQDSFPLLIHALIYHRSQFNYPNSLRDYHFEVMKECRYQAKSLLLGCQQGKMSRAGLSRVGISIFNTRLLDIVKILPQQMRKKIPVYDYESDEHRLEINLATRYRVPYISDYVDVNASIKYIRTNNMSYECPSCSDEQVIQLLQNIYYHFDSEDVNAMVI